MSHHGKSKLINLKCFKLSLVEGCGSLKEEKEEAVLTMGRKLETKENKNKIKRIIENYTPALVLIPFVKFSITISQTKWRILWMKNTNHCYNVLLTMKDEIQNNERKERTSHFFYNEHTFLLIQSCPSTGRVCLLLQSVRRSSTQSFSWAHELCRCCEETTTKDLYSAGNN